MSSLYSIEGSTIITLDEKQSVIVDGEIWIENDKILFCGPKKVFEYQGSKPVKKIDGRNRIAIPGLVNGHVHSYGALLKGSVDALPLDAFMINAIASAGKRSPRDAYISAILGAIEMVSTGTTACLDHCSHRPVHTAEALDAIAQAYADVGMRASLAPMFSDLPFSETVPFENDMPSEELTAWLPKTKPNIEAYFETVEEVLEKWAEHPLVNIMLGVDSPQRCSDNLLKKAGIFCNKHGIGNHTHLLEAKTQLIMSKIRDQRGFVKYLQDCGLAGPLSSFAHFVWCSREEIEAVEQAGATVVHNPSSNLILGSGIQPLLSLVDSGVPVALGTDGLNAANGSMFEKIRLATLLHRVTESDSDFWIEAGPMLRLATVNGARMLGAENKRGVLKAGQHADVVLLDSQSITYTPLGDPETQVLHYESGGSVREVFVSGKQIVENGEVSSIDKQSIFDEAIEISERLKRDAKSAVNEAEKMHPNIKSMVKRVHATECGPCRIARI